MPCQSPKLNPRSIQKQLLIAESEINRKLLQQDCAALGGSVRQLVTQSKRLGAIAGSGALLVSVWSAFRKQTRAAEDRRPHWLTTCLKVFKLGAALWKATPRAGLSPNQTNGVPHSNGQPVINQR